MAFRVYLSTDGDAPALEQQPGSLVNVLRKCLVDGYGTGTEEQPPAGWHMDMGPDNLQAAFRSNSLYSPQHWCYIDDRGLIGDGPSHAWLRASFEFDGWDVNDEPLFVDPYPTVSQRSNGVAQRKANTGSATGDVVDWMVVADARTFWVITDGNDNGFLRNFNDGSFDNYLGIGGFGDTRTLTESPYPCMIAGNPEVPNNGDSEEILKQRDGSTISSWVYLSIDHSAATVGVRPRMLTASGGVQGMPRLSQHPIILDQNRLLYGGARVEALRGLRDPLVYMESLDDYVELFGQPNTGNPGFTTIGTGESERFVVTAGRIGEDERLCMFNLQEPEDD